MLGPLELVRGGETLSLPTSRKARALLAYLTLTRRPVTRSQLCELLWNSPADPRGELRWCLSKIRRLLDDEERCRVLARSDAVQLDLDGCFVDALEILRADNEQIAALAFEQQRNVEALFGGDLLEGLDMSASPAFESWLTAQRHRFRAFHAALLEHLAGRVSDSDAFAYLDKWGALTPFDRRFHELYLAALARAGRIREGEEHVAVTVRRFEAEGLETESLRRVWRSTRKQPGQQGAALPPGMLAQFGPGRGSIAVMPFADHSIDGRRRAAADALALDVTARLAKQRNLLVIAQSMVFALHQRGIGADEAARILDVDYIVGGSVRTDGNRLVVNIELVETRAARIVWSEIYDCKLDEASFVPDEISNGVVACIAAEIEALECNRARLKPPSSLDAREAYHRGLWHMYRYRKADNDQARNFFELSLKLDPTLARAYAGLSFTHFQCAFQQWEARDLHVDRAYAAAAQGVMADERDPAAQWALGRALYLRRDWKECEAALMRSIELSPNYALGHYNLSFVRSVVGDPRVAIADADLSRQLSPHDPMLFGMLATRAMALVRLGEFEEAAEWAVKAAARPNAFPHIYAIAAYALALAGSLSRARGYAAAARRVVSRYEIAEFLLAFPFEADGEAPFRKGAKAVGM